MTSLHIDAGLELRGGQYQALRLVEALPGATLLAPAASALFTQARCRGLRCEPLSAASLWSLSRRVDLTHAHDARAHTLAALLAGSPFIVSRRVAFPVQTGLLSRWKYRRPRRFIAVSRAVRARLLSAGIPAKKISVVYDGVPLLPQSTLQGEMITPATSDPMKHPELLAGLGVRSSTDLESDLRTARLLVYLSREEGLGSAVLLAMSAGVPVVASNIGGLPEIVEHGRTGLLVENSRESVAEAIRKILPEWGPEARRRVEARFTVEAMARATMDTYREVLAC
jgi:glycosyltransferase involved in cell wall biosynthesis